MTAKSEDISEGFTSITTADLARAVNFTAHWIDSLPHLSPGSSETIGFIGSQDFRYWVLELASIKTGHPLLLPSIKNALPNTISLLEVTKCKVLLYSGPLKDQAVALSKNVQDLEILEIPSLKEMVNANAEHYPYTKSWEEAKKDIVMIVHTSGSTGAPKPIYYTNEFIGGAIDSQELVPPMQGRTLASLALLKRKKPFFTGTPFFHLSGIVMGFHTMFCRSTAVMCPPNSPPTGKLVRDIARSVKLNGMITVPSLLDAMFSEDGEDILPFLSDVEHICWLGGRLPF
jgi:long-subunit acyl-CoA synthetase (AMP-forming)